MTNFNNALTDRTDTTAMGNITEEVTATLAAADAADKAVFAMIRDDATWTDSLDYRSQFRPKARRRKNELPPGQ